MFLEINKYFKNISPPSISNIDFRHNYFFEYHEKNQKIFTLKIDIKTLKFNSFHPVLENEDRNYLIRAPNIDYIKEKIQEIINKEYRKIIIINNYAGNDNMEKVNIELTDDFIINIYLEFKPVIISHNKYNDYEEEILNMTMRIFRDLLDLNEGLPLIYNN